MKSNYLYENFMEDNILACYLRVSDEDFDLKQNVLKDESTSISAQRRLIHSYIESKPELKQMNIREFLDDGYSGTNFERPAIQEIFQLVSEGRIGAIIVKDMSRFGRNYIETGCYIEQVFPLIGIRFISINDSFDSSEYIGNTPGLEMAFKNVIYDYYSKDLSAKVKSIKKIQQKRGDFVAAKPPYGYIISRGGDARHCDRHKLEVDPKSAQVVKNIFRLTLSGWKPVRIAQWLNELLIPTPAQRLHKLYGFQCGGFTEDQLMSQIWKPVQVSKILQDETMTGATVNNRVQVKGIGSRKFKRQKTEDHVVVRDTHEAIIDRDTFLQAAAIIRNRKTVRTDNRKKNENLFYQKIFCGHCGCRLKHEVHTRHSRIDAIYYCPHARPSGGGTCNLHSIKDEFLKEQVLRPLQVQVQLILDKQMPLPKSDKEKFQSRLRAISRLQEQNKGKVPRLYEEYRTGKINREQFVKQKDAISSANNELDSERSEIEEKLYAIESAQKKTESESLLEITRLKTLTQNAVDLFVSKIVIHSKNPGDSLDSIEITWKSKDLFDEIE
ncbi:MAG: recombinase family protein [Lachnospiraceae bacterium]|nr:recombinase family protein [Lachnospiraceae bacterium]